MTGALAFSSTFKIAPFVSVSSSSTSMWRYGKDERSYPGASRTPTQRVKQTH